MKAVIKLIIIVIFLSGCNVAFPGDNCDPKSTAPYSDVNTVGAHCANKCCAFVIYKEAEVCHEMWCYTNCEWKMNHEACY